MINTSYVLWMADSVLICAAMHYCLAAGLKRRGLLSAVTCVLSAALGIALARLAYCLIQINYVVYDGFWETVWSGDLSCTSYYGGVAGAVLGAWLAALLTGNRPMEALNAWAPAGALMAAQARFAEYFLGTLRAGGYLEDPAVQFFPLAIGNEWGEWYLAVFMLAGLAYLAVFFLSLLRFRKSRFLRTLFYLCLLQIILESLRNQSLIWSEFVRAEQLLCMVAVEAVLILLSVRVMKKGVPFGRAFLPAFAGLLCAGLFVAVEFTVGGKVLATVPGITYYAYGVMLLGLGVLAALEALWTRKLNGR
ncbi:MAG: prolipoprotein diacylglyceryl transferase [Clostridiales bacterium]|nr:prolipoprotein diacylglyceryl transferase [Clostridiales bacterium]